MGRIREIYAECGIAAAYFKRHAGFLLYLDEVYMALKREKREKTFPSMEVLRERNRRLYEDILGAAYESSYTNPAYAVKEFGLEAGRMLAFLSSELRGGIAYIYEDRLEEWAPCLELFIEIYNLYESKETNELTKETFLSEMKETLYYFVSDYCDVTVVRRIREQIDPSLDFAVRIIMDQELSDLRYLYQFGEYISENELRTAAFLNSLPEETIEKMASVYTKGYRRGFELAGIDLSKKKTVEIRYCVGFERVVRQAVRQFEKMGLSPVLFRAAVGAANKRQHLKIGYYGAYANKQYEYDHRFDSALFLDKAYKERKLSVMRVAYEEYKELAAVYAGPAVMETFGETPFSYQNKPEAFSLNERQKRLSVELASQSGEIVNQYIKGEERSFTIISWPVPEIGKDFEEIFKETIRINTLDYEQYKKIQGILIDALDEGEFVEIRGRNGNRTYLRVALHVLKDRKKESNFENCLADVNIPLGEVFTSPRLSGTDGVLHVSQIYINEVEYKNLEIHFRDGMTTEYSCSNYETEEENRSLVEENLLYNHPALPMGEFAVGTNTAAYAMAKKYGIIDRLKILIIEKMGPHFAIGDTCYSHSEDVKVYNPDGKEIVARDNECSLRRKEDPQKAYFNCHTDITIPYDELGEIAVLHADGSRTPVILDGRFVLKGTEMLNEPF
ncbi:aminopeptidase [Lacrimispora sp. NSJ-141]|uniref:Aminopeptidase n=1 Tax=Lientehia hominis TaxID=2897778 RepID=A0AAP2RJZ5_9FIRM|nr:aminopeptidase [Lientehia hominis]MCD2492813.1 aminopeptidase [Lientehia hominis]